MRVCDNCKREPEPFETDQEVGYFFVVPRSTQDLVVLMSNLEYMFAICTERNPPDDSDNNLICINCHTSMME